VKKSSARGVVVVTGASAGLGRAIVQRFADRGARIGLIARGLDRLEATQHDVESRGGEAPHVPPMAAIGRGHFRGGFSDPRSDPLNRNECIRLL